MLIEAEKRLFQCFVFQNVRRALKELLTYAYLLTIYDWFAYAEHRQFSICHNL